MVVLDQPDESATAVVRFDLEPPDVAHEATAIAPTQAVRELRAKRVEKSTADPFAKFGPKPAVTLLADPPPSDHPLPPTTEATEIAHKIATAATQRAAAEAAGMAWGKLVKHARDLGLDAHALLGTKANED